MARKQKKVFEKKKLLTCLKKKSRNPKRRCKPWNDINNTWFMKCNYRNKH